MPPASGRASQNRQVVIAAVTTGALAHVPEKWEPVFR
jgi:hypothetical protein